MLEWYKNDNNCWHFNINEQFDFHAQLSLARKSLQPQDQVCLCAVCTYLIMPYCMRENYTNSTINPSLAAAVIYHLHVCLQTKRYEQTV